MTWAEIWQVVYKTIICYFFLIFILKLMGKREIGKVSTFDIVVFFVISELFSLSLNEPDGSILHSLIPIGLIVLLQLLTALLSLKSNGIRSIVEGKLTYIIYKGEINQKEMRRQRYNIDDLLSQLRTKDIQLPSDVEFAILEDNGNLNVIQKEDCELQDPEPLISDGKKVKRVLKRLHISDEELHEKIVQCGYQHEGQIFLALLRSDGTLFAVERKLAKHMKHIDRNRKKDR